MKDISQYPVSFRFGATTWPYTPSHPHSGEDRAAPCGTPIIVNGATIGLVGTTGKSTGCHLHVQKVAGGMVVHPKGGGFKIAAPAEVYETGQRSDIGKYVRIKDASNIMWSYFHLSQINAKKGVLKGTDMYKGKSAEYWYKKYITSHTRMKRVKEFFTRLFKRS